MKLDEVKLTPLQEASVKARGKNILVSAGAGTGKTRVLVERFLHFLISGECGVSDILALTFTEKAANEMKSRILKRCSALGMDSARRGLESAYISTLHAFAARLLREHPIEAGVDPDFRVMESEETLFYKDQILEEIFEKYCRNGNELFELLRFYGESRIRSALLDAHEAARQSGKNVRTFFNESLTFDHAEKSSEINRELQSHFIAVEENELLESWKRFYAQSEWDWPAAKEFRLWRQGFSRKRGKKGENHWSEIKRLSDCFFSVKMEMLAAPWKKRFEALAELFEEAYEARKKERGVLDFEDLELRAVALFKKDTPVHHKLRERYQNKFRQILVDEFQDTNALQMELINLLSSGANLFFVGDYKQSIYAFRGAEPSLFLEREEEHKKENSAGAFIPLYENFRTAEPALEFINRFFSGLWQEDAFSFEPLMARAEADQSGGVDLIVIWPEEKESLDAVRMREADRIAERMLSLHEQEGIGFGNMAILFQAMTNVALYEQALKKRGIPAYVMAGGGFYHQPEVRDVVSLLSFLENPCADIPLAAALRSPLFQIQDNTLFWISRLAKAEDKEGEDATPLLRGLDRVLERPEVADKEKEKIFFFKKVTEELLAMKDRLKLTEMLDLIMARTSYELTLLAAPHGVRRYANIRKLMNLARQFEAVEPLSLGSFLQVVKRLESRQVRESEAQIEPEQSGEAVRLLSIHRAKGLEFDAVFVADLGRERQSSDAKTFVAEPRLGYGLQVRNEITLEWENPFGWIEIEEALRKREKEEWKRLFYVAMTRAKRHLILSGVYKEKKKAKEAFSEMSSWMEWLMNSDLSGVRVEEGASSAQMRSPRALAEKKDREEWIKLFSPDGLRNMIPEAARKEAALQAEKLFKGLERSPVRPSRVIHLPVSAYAAYAKSPLDYWRAYEVGISRAAPEKPSEQNSPDEEESPDPADFGTAMHRALELLDFKHAEEEVLNRVIEESFRAFSSAAREEALFILQNFKKSDLFKRLAGAKKVFRELPFILNERHGLIHGVIDILFQESDGRWHVLDYKTASGSKESLKGSGYETQIELYAFAVHEILGEAPSSGILYFLKNGWQYERVLAAADYAVLKKETQLIQENILSVEREILK